MEENVALDSTKQKKFVKSIKGIKKLIKKNEVEKVEEPEAPKPKERKSKRKRPDRGLVYLSHIPHGFYEHEMTQYFKQFGVVTNVRVIRSKRTGNSKGYAFVEFREPAVAEIVAETMNNYLMGKRLIKAAVIPPEKQRCKAMRKHWSRLNNPGRDARLKNKKAYNENKDEQGELKRARKILSNLNKTKKKLSDMGINYDFFTPVDIPETLQESLKEKVAVDTTVKEEKKPKKDKNVQDNVEDKNKKVSLKKEKHENKKAVINEKPVKIETKKSDVKKEKQKAVPEPVLNKKEQNLKQQKLKDSGVKPPENFIKVQEDANDSDSSVDFDSDEYNKMLEDDESDVDSGDEEDDDDEGDDGSEDDESEDEDDEVASPPKKSKGKPVVVLKPQPQRQVNNQKKKEPEQVKRKVPQKPAVAPKKPKFEKQTQQSLKKQFKKKK